MKTSILSAAILSFAVLGSGSAFAVVDNNYPAENTTNVSVKTRADVKAELAEAIRTGNIIVNGQLGLTAYQLNPSAYPTRPMAMSKTRAQVQRELNAARANGDLMRAGVNSVNGDGNS